MKVFKIVLEIINGTEEVISTVKAGEDRLTEAMN